MCYYFEYHQKQKFLFTRLVFRASENASDVTEGSCVEGMAIEQVMAAQTVMTSFMTDASLASLPRSSIYQESFWYMDFC